MRRFELVNRLGYVADQHIGHVATEGLLDVHANRVHAFRVRRHAEGWNDPTLLGKRMHKVRGVVLALILETATAARRIGSVVDQGNRI